MYNFFRLERLSTFSDAFFGFLNRIRQGVGLLWTRDQFAEKASTDKGQHNILTQETNMHAISGIRTRNLSNQAAKNYALEFAATKSGLNFAVWF
jgi:hypothetical protein